MHIIGWHGEEAMRLARDYHEETPIQMTKRRLLNQLHSIHQSEQNLSKVAQRSYLHDRAWFFSFANE